MWNASRHCHPAAHLQDGFDRGPAHDFDEVVDRAVSQAILDSDKRCDGRKLDDGTTPPDLRATKLTDWSSITPGNGGGHAGHLIRGEAVRHRHAHQVERGQFAADEEVGAGGGPGGDEVGLAG